MKGGRNVLYTVKEVSEMSNVTIKTLHHYHKIGLLLPREISESGYRLYGDTELERLQEILFYRELEFPLHQIKEMLERHSDRKSILAHQEKLLFDRKQRLESIVETLRKSLNCLEEGRAMDNKDMFKGLTTAEEWDHALMEQNQHLKESYGMEPLKVNTTDVPELNEQAAEAMTFMNAIADCLREGIKHQDDKVTRLIRDHLLFLNEHGHRLSPVDFAAQTQFFLSDDFHLQMLESQQTGLAYYLSAAATAYAATTQ
ncbi:MerR family transcriptional regulator [Paenibacillus nanensis]|uniref:MerR family transcriptional regulator n=1 Tax=Paenibacillus nanensis TaxID=393251 RepID=A0A3A1UKE2_9BACL|nr:MerR family transcriptional regulator [Paenibacillus nanensis]RIX47946.1 MerR family transcriptional regulator [Paenibacillus nanensis]